MMLNYLFEDLETGERFFIQCETFEEAHTEALDICTTPEDCEYLGEFTDYEAEWYGYDTY